MAQALTPTRWLLLADAVLLLHVLFVGFVLLGLLLVLIGGWRGWRWVRNPWFRITHLAAILFVVGQTWLDMPCPLTTLELAFRARAGGPTYAGSFIGHWLQTLLYYQAPNWVFAIVYSALALAVVWSWIKVRPAPFAGSRSSRY